MVVFCLSNYGLNEILPETHLLKSYLSYVKVGSGSFLRGPLESSNSNDMWVLFFGRNYMFVRNLLVLLNAASFMYIWTLGIVGNHGSTVISQIVPLSWFTPQKIVMWTLRWPLLFRCSIYPDWELCTYLGQFGLCLFGPLVSDDGCFDWLLQICRVEQVVVEGIITGSVIHFLWVRAIIIPSSGVISASGLGKPCTSSLLNNFMQPEKCELIKD